MRGGTKTHVNFSDSNGYIDIHIHIEYIKIIVVNVIFPFNIIISTFILLNIFNMIYFLQLKWSISEPQLSYA